MKIYRLETVNNEGPYSLYPQDYEGTYHCLGYPIGQNHTANTGHPTPSQEGIPLYGVNADGIYVSGFQSIEHLTQWFSDEKHRLRMYSYGVQLHVYEISDFDVCFGQKQLTFDITRARLQNVYSYVA